MGLLESTIAGIGEPDWKSAAAVSDRLREAFPQADSLGALRALLLRYVAVTGLSEVLPPRPCTVICCADHGVAAEDVSAYPQTATREMLRNYLISQGAAANVFANFAESELLVADLGVKGDTSGLPNLIRKPVAPGTQNLVSGPAMTREQAVQAVETGIWIAQKCTADGVNVILPGEMGIGNTTSSAAMASVLAGIPVEQAVGRGSNISAEKLRHKRAVVARALAVNQPDADDALDVLAKLGGFELAGIVGLILGGAAGGAMVILDGLNCAVAALLAAKLAPQVKGYLQPSQRSEEPAQPYVLEALGLEPLLDLHFRLGEACGSSLVLDALYFTIEAYSHLTDADDADMPGEMFQHEYMPQVEPVVTDKTFDFYLRTMPELDEPSMRMCRARLDSLTKPKNSLGFLEDIAVELAGIDVTPYPEKGTLAASLLVFTREKLPEANVKLLDAVAHCARADVTEAHLRQHLSPKAAFDFARTVTEEITFDSTILGLALGRNIGRDLSELLLEPDGSFRYAPQEFLAHIPEPLQAEVSAIIGAIVAAAHNSSLIVLDNGGVGIIASYLMALCPELEPFLFFAEPEILRVGVDQPCGVITELGMSLVQASIAIVNDMKTFEEAGVHPSLAAEKIH
ncbi:MAG: nicotinate-nucleotide--dimethylbenzimidazole phosphoribosyltransferase [Selenomonadaceae bacterium]|nr:nicotinate-nucleotide--dimethylbenzimidazole phosphoribosyltransferase [Selenomonadaceae bacterium]